MMTTTKHLLFWALAVTGPLSTLPAQFGGNPMEEIKEIADAVDKQLKEIDRLLLESGKKGQARKTPKEMLEQASEGSKIAEDGIDKLIEKLSEMSQQSSSSSSSSEQESQQQQQGQQRPNQQQQGQQQNRRENQTPDFVQQPQDSEQQQQQQREQQQQQGQETTQNRQGQPQGAEEQPTSGENQVGANPQESPTGDGKPGKGTDEWGGLQPYLNFLKNRGASPKVPEKFRRYYEAYLKNKSKGGKK